MTFEKLLIDFGGIPDALSKINQVPNSFRRKNKSGINDRIFSSVPEAPVVGEGKQYSLQQNCMQHSAKPPCARRQILF